MSIPPDITLLRAAIPQGERGSRRQREREVAMALLQERYGSEVELTHDPNGAPSLVGIADRISISHCIDEVVVAIHPRHPIGVDIETWRGQLAKVKNKYVSDRELAGLHLPHDTALLYAWTAKEAIYKLINHPSLSPLDDIELVNLDRAIAGGRQCDLVQVELTPRRVITLAMEAAAQ